MSRSLVTGAGGFIGQELVKYLRSKNCETYSWTRATGNLLNEQQVKKVLDSYMPETIYHLAAGKSEGSNHDWQNAAAEVQMFTNLLRHTSRSCKLIVAGSMAEIGYAGVHAEDCLCKPDTAYGFAKNCLVNAAIAMRHNHGRDIRVARLFGVFGPGEGPTRLIPTLVRQLAIGQRVPLSDGNQLRDFVHVNDVCRILKTLADSSGSFPSVLNIGTGKSVSVREVCESVADYLGADRQLLGFGDMARRIVDQDILVADVSRLGGFTDVPKQFWPRSPTVLEYVGSLAKLQ